MSKHTPVPWRLSANGLQTNDGAIAVLHDSADSQDCTHIAHVTCQATFKRGQGWNAECAVRDANARLIAAAPELLQACKQALYDLKGREHDQYLRDAIAKAKGGAA